MQCVEDIKFLRAKKRKRYRFCARQRKNADADTPLTLVLCLLFMSWLPNVRSQHVEDLSWRNFSEPQKKKKDVGFVRKKKC